MRPLVPLVLLAPVLAGCPGGGLNIFSVQDDIELGQQVRDEIAADPETFPIVDEADYPEAYAHLRRIRDAVLDSGEVRFDDRFEWEVYLIDDPDTLNAFVAPGGYMYFYTGLIRFLDSEDHFAGVMGHEIAHADRRHTTQRLTAIYGVSTLLGVVLGEEPGLIAEIAAGLAFLEFSRQNEAEADAYSVRYLCETPYAADGAAGFFQKLLDLEDGGIRVPVFLSTHPASQDRVDAITDFAEELGCSTAPNPGAQWEDFLSSLP